MNNKKKILIASTATLGCAVVALGAYAYFSDQESETSTGTVGTVDITTTDPTFTHTYNGQTAPNNINPGDNDPGNHPDDDPDDPSRDGTDHELSFTVSNAGTKSVITRTKITVEAVDEEGEPITADILKHIILSEKLDDDDVVTTESVLTPESYEDTDTELLYIVGGYEKEGDDERGKIDIMNGVGDNAEIEQDVTATSITKTFDVGLEKIVGTNNEDATNALEGATITFTIEVQAMQYRNTNNADWETLSINQVTSTTSD